MTDEALQNEDEKILSDGEVVRRLWAEIKKYVGPLLVAASLYIPLVLGGKSAFRWVHIAQNKNVTMPMLEHHWH